MKAVAGAVDALHPRPRRLTPPRLSEPWRRRLPLLPALLVMIVLTQVPFVMSIYYSLTDWHVVPPGTRKFIGLHNYGTLFSDTFFRQAVWVSVKLTVIPVFVALLLGTAFAVLLDRK